MYHRRVLWMILWFLMTQVSSCLLFSCCKPTSKEKVVLKPKTNENTPINQIRIIHDDVSKLTDYQKTYARRLYPVVVYFCGELTTSKRMTRLIVTYLAPPLPAEISTEGVVNKFQLSFDDQWLAISQLRLWGHVTLWCRENGQKHATLHGHTDTISDLTFTSDSQRLLSASHDTTLILWSVRTGSRLYIFRGHFDWVTSCSLTADNQRLLSCSYDQTIRIWSLQTDDTDVKIPVGFFPSTGAWFCHHDQYVITAARDQISLWTVTGMQVRVIRITSWASVLAYNEVRFLLADRSDRSVQVWDFATDTCVQIFRGHAHQVWFGCFVQNDTSVVSWDALYRETNKTVCIWGVQDGICTHRFDNYVVTIPKEYWLESRNTGGIIVSTPNNEVHVLEINSGKIIFTFQGVMAEYQETIRISFDGQFLVWNSYFDGKIRFMRFSHHKKITHD